MGETPYLLRSGSAFGWVAAAGVHGRMDMGSYHDRSMFDGRDTRADVDDLFSHRASGGHGGLAGGQPAGTRCWVIGVRGAAGRHSLTRQPDGLRLNVSSWDEVWAACPEFGVPWRSVRFESPQARAEVLIDWGTHPDMPS